MMPQCDIEELRKKNESLVLWVKLLQNDEIKHKENCKTLARKLKEKAPELEGWLKTNFGEYL